MNFRLKGKTALVTGGSKGIGKAVASLLVDMGADVIIASRSQENLMLAASELGVRAIQADVLNPQQIKSLVAEVGPVDILVTNAGGPPTGLPSEQSDEDWRLGYELTLMSTIRLVRAVLPEMRQRYWGRIIAITSLTVGRPALGMPVSNVMRAGVTNFVKSLALEVARDGVTVNTVAPGYTATEHLKEVISAEAEQRILERIPTARLGTPQEIAAAVAFLASPAASYITGHELLVDGGWSI